MGQVANLRRIVNPPSLWGGQSWLQPAFSRLNQEPPLIPERFPPLSELLKTWGFEQRYWTGPIRYISHCLNSNDDLHMLETLPAPKRASQPLEFAARQIRQRLQSVRQ